MKIGQQITTVVDIDRSIDYHTNRISLEAGVVSNAAKLLIDILPDFITKLSSDNRKITELDNTEIIRKGLSEDARDALKRIPNMDYLNYADTPIMVPEGFKGNLIDYIRLVLEVTPEFYSKTSSTLNELSVILSTVITNKEAKTSIKENAHIFIKADKYRSDIVKALNASFDYDKKGFTRVRMCTTIRRSAELESVILELDHLNKLKSNLNTKELQSVVDKNIELMNMILKDVKENPNSEYSGTVVKDISKGAYTCGKLVEMCSVLYYDLETLIATVTGIIDQLNGVKHDPTYRGGGNPPTNPVLT